MTTPQRSSQLARFSIFAGFFSIVVGILALFGWAIQSPILKSVVPGFFTIGWLRLAGERQGWYGTELGLALFATVSTGTLLLLLLWTARSLNYSTRIRNLAQRSRDESESRLRRIAETIPGVVYQYQLDPDGSQRFLYLSRASQELFGYPVDQVLNDFSLAWNGVLPEDVEPLRASIRRSAETLSPWRHEFRLRRPDGSVIWVKGRSAPEPRHPDGSVVWSGILLDITARKATDQALRESEERFEKAFRSSPHPVGITELETGICIDVNDACLAFFGFSREEVIGRSTLDLHIWPRPEDRARVVRYLRAQGSIANQEMTLRTKQGESRHFLFSAELIELKGVPCIITVGNDITDRKRTEEALRASEERYRTLIQTAGSVILVLAPDHTILEWNHAAEALYGYSREEVLGRNYLAMFLPQEVHEAVTADISQVMIGRPTRDFENLVSTKSGETRMLLWNVTRVLDAAGQPAGVMAIGQDITVRKQAHSELERRVAERTAALAESQTRMEVILAGTSVATWDWEIKTGHVTYNEQWAVNRGLRFEDIMPNISSWIEGVHPEDWPRVEQTINDYLTGKTATYECEMRVKTAAGEWTWIMDRGQIIERAEDGSPRRMAGIELDITTRKRSDQALRNSEMRLSQAIEATSLGLFDHDHQTGHLYWSPKMRELLGIGSDVAPSSSRYLALVHPNDQSSVAAAVQQAHEAGGDGRFGLEHRLVQPDGTVRWVSLRSQTLFEGTGVNRHPIRTTGTMMDITERKRAEAALRESEELFAKAFQSSPDPIVLAELGTGRWLDVNEACLAGLKRRREDTVGRTGEEIGHWMRPEDRARFVERLKRDGAVRDLEASFQTADGEARDCLVSAEVIEYSGKPCMIVISKDITDRKRVEEELRVTQFAMDQAGDAILWANSEKRLVYVNQAACRSLGYTRQELLQLTIPDIAPLHDPASHHERMMRLQEEQSIQYESVHRTKNGHLIPVDLTVTLLSHKGQEYSCAIARDITDRKRAYSLLEAAMNSTADGLLVVDLNGQVTSMNDRCRQLWNIPVELATEQDDATLLQFAMRQLEHPEDFLRSVQQLYAQPELEHQDLLKFADGRVFERYSRPQRLGDTIVGRVWSFRNVTERRRAEEALAERARLAEFAAEVSLKLNSECSIEERLRHCADAVVRILGAAFARVWTVEPGDLCDTCSKKDLCTDRTQCLHLQASAGLSTNVNGEYRRVPLGALKIGRIAQGTGVMSSNDILNDDRLPNKEWMKAQGLQSFAGFPLVIEGTVYGVLALFARTPLSDAMIKTVESTCNGVAAAIARQQAKVALRFAYDQLRDLAKKLESAKEAERQRIARELHDEFGQALTGLKFDVSWIRTKLERVQQTPAGRGLIKKTDTMTAAIDALIDAVRETATSLRPSVLDDLGLIPALDWLVKKFRSSTSIDYTLEVEAEIEQVVITAEASTSLFRLAQEMLTNVARHAKATHAHLRLFHTSGSITLECTDDGEGIPAHRINHSTSLGLRGMEERAALLGGSFAITGVPGIGTTTRASLPLSSSASVHTMENHS